MFQILILRAFSRIRELQHPIKRPYNLLAALNSNQGQRDVKMPMYFIPRNEPIPLFSTYISYNNQSKASLWCYFLKFMVRLILRTNC
jgi:hypothetical protein